MNRLAENCTHRHVVPVTIGAAGTAIVDARHSCPDSLRDGPNFPFHILELISAVASQFDSGRLIDRNRFAEGILFRVYPYVTRGLRRTGPGRKRGSAG